MAPAMSCAALLAALCATAAEGIMADSMQHQQQNAHFRRTSFQRQLGAASPRDIKGIDAGATSFVRALEYKHNLRVCNAFPSGVALEVFRGKEEHFTSDAPMPYKACRDFVSPLRAGDKLEFQLGDTSAGTFSISDLPSNDAVLLLVVHRHDTMSTAVAFESHVFASLGNAQVAVIDTYKGSAKSTPRILDGVAASSHPNSSALSARSKPRKEELRYNSVVAVSPGIYDVELDNLEGKTEAKSQLVALNRESYVVLRTGVESHEGPAYPEELVVYPNSNPSIFTRSGLTAVSLSSTVALLCAFVMALS